jgi:hypothetical protein
MNWTSLFPLIWNNPKGNSSLVLDPLILGHGSLWGVFNIGTKGLQQYLIHLHGTNVQPQTQDLYHLIYLYFLFILRHFDSSQRCLKIFSSWGPPNCRRPAAVLGTQDLCKGTTAHQRRLCKAQSGIRDFLLREAMFLKNNRKVYVICIYIYISIESLIQLYIFNYIIYTYIYVIISYIYTYIHHHHTPIKVLDMHGLVAG